MFQTILLSTSSGLKFVYISRFAGNVIRTTGKIARGLKLRRRIVSPFSRVTFED